MARLPREWSGVEGKELAIWWLRMEVPLGKVKEDPSRGCVRELARRLI